MSAPDAEAHDLWLAERPQTDPAAGLDDESNWPFDPVAWRRQHGVPEPGPHPWDNEEASVPEFKPGLYHDVPEDDYLTGTFGPPEGSLSSSGAKTLLKAPAKFRWQLEHPRTSDTFDFGHAAHQVVLGAGPGLAIIPPTSRAKADQVAHKEAKEKARAEGKIPLTEDDHAAVLQMADAIASDPAASKLLTGGQPEVSAYAIDEETGIWRRCRFDYLRPLVGVDLKSTRSAHPWVFAKQCHDLGYHISAAYYLDIATDLGLDMDDFAFIACEKEPPYLVAVYRLDEESMDLGRRQYRKALEVFRDCRETDLWPGYPVPEDHTISLPGYAFKEYTA